MEFPGHLVEGVLIKKHNNHLADVAVSRDDRLLVKLQSDNALPGYGTLGTRLWFTVNEKFDASHQVCQLVEVDGGHLVFVNSAMINSLAAESIECGLIEELQDCYKPTLGAVYPQSHEQADIYLESKAGGVYVECQEVTMGDEIHRGFVPDCHNNRYSDDLRKLIHAKQLGHRAVLLYCVNHTGIDWVFPADHIDPNYGALLRQAVSVGVEVIAYRIAVSLTHIALIEAIPAKVPAKMY